MIKLIKNVKLYAPEYQGIKDVLIVGDKIGEVADSITFNEVNGTEIEEIDGTGKIMTPGFIDSHVHILGGGGEGSYKTRTPEIMLSNITSGGVTTVVGCLGTDGVSRNPISLLAKARGLEEEGITTYIYSGSYRIPLTTITKDLISDIIVIDKIIGAGEVALSDHRSSQPTLDELKKLTSDARVGGMLSGKAGIVNIHMGDGKDMLNMLFEIAATTEIPMTQFIPTHINRNKRLLAEGKRYAKQGGFIDFTTSADPSFWVGEDAETRCSIALKECLNEGVPIEKITFSSDGQGSLPVFNDKNELLGLGVGKVTSLYAEVRDAVVNHQVPLELALQVITSTPAKALKLHKKGRIAKDMDSDICLLDENTYEIDTVIAKGQTMVAGGKVLVFGTFEN